MSDKLQQAIALIRSGDKQNGGRLLAEVLKDDPQNEMAWLWMSGIVSRDEQRRHCLTQVLAINPNNQLAQKGLAQLQPGRQSGHIEGSEQATSVSAQPQPQVTKPTPLPPGSVKSILEGQPPALLSPFSPSAPQLTQAPAEKGKNVWVDAERYLNTVVVLGDDTLVIANPSAEELKRIQTETESEAGVSISSLVGRKQAVPLSSITQVSANEQTFTAHVRYEEHNRPALRVVHFADSNDRNEFFDALQQKLGPGSERTTKEVSIFLAIFWPTVALAVVIYGTYLFHGAALESVAGAEPTIKGRYGLVKLIAAWLTQLVGPTGVIIVGGLLVILIFFWIGKQIMKPPIETILVPVKDPAAE
jgi:hypothetical protein